MQRFTANLTLACILHLQFACCCAGRGGVKHDESACCASESCGMVKRCAPGSDCSHAHEQAVKVVPCDKSHHHESKDAPAPTGQGCHLCILSHLQFVPTAQAPPVDFMAINLPLEPELAATCRQTLTLASRSPAWQSPSTLVNCGSLLRI